MGFFVLPSNKLARLVLPQWAFNSLILKHVLLTGLVLIMASVLTSCARINKAVTPYKQIAPRIKQITPMHTQVKPAPLVFQYSYKEPVRTSSSATLSKQLSTGKDGSLVAVQLKDKTTSKARLGRSYFSASGYECRKYLINTQNEYTSCFIGGRWLETSPIAHDSTNNTK